MSKKKIAVKRCNDTFIDNMPKYGIGTMDDFYFWTIAGHIVTQRWSRNLDNDIIFAIKIKSINNE